MEDALDTVLEQHYSQQQRSDTQTILAGSDQDLPDHAAPPPGDLDLLPDTRAKTVPTREKQAAPPTVSTTDLAPPSKAKGGPAAQARVPMKLRPWLEEQNQQRSKLGLSPLTFRLAKTANW